MWSDREDTPSIPAGRPVEATDRRLIVVSNRQPYRYTWVDGGDSIEIDQPSGGLTAGLDPVMQHLGGTWIAWGDGDADAAVTDGNGCVAVPPDREAYLLKRLWLTDEEVDAYYYGYSNQVLWPLCHSAIGKIRSSPDYWRQYRSVNVRFADAIVDHLNGPSLVWFHDYHLALAPRMVRSRLAGDHTLMHFWHIPWPSWDVFRSCPHTSELLDGLLGNDVVTFHVPRYVANFLSCVDRGLDEVRIDHRHNTVAYRGRTTSVRAVPMGVPFEDIQRAARSAGAAREWRAFRDSHGIDPSVRIGVGVDRIDYTKGLIQRLRALEWLWAHHPEWRGSFTFVQKGSESRSKIPAYRRVQRQVATEVDRINGRFATASWQPIIYTTDELSREALYGVYRHASIGIVSAIRDGMNLVAQEYAAAQVDNDGVLLLSEQTGAHDEFGDVTVGISPHDTQAFGRAIARALSMSQDERVNRMRSLRSHLQGNDIGHWLDRNLALAAPSSGPAAGQILYGSR